MGAFLTAGYVFQTLGLEETTASNTGFITGLVVVITPLLGWAFLRDRLPAIAWIGAVASAVGLYLLSGAGGDFTLRGDGLVLLCAVAFAGHILVTARGVRDHDVGALLVVQLGLCGIVCLAIAGLAGDLESARGGDGLVGADRDLAGGQRARASSSSPTPSSTRRRPAPP